MCGIAGGDDVAALIQRMEHRGDTATVDTAASLGHVYHPVVGDVSQPLDGDGPLVANCEIYNWEDLADEHGIAAANDAELLHTLLEREGEAALGQLDGVYALAYREDGGILLARDRLGVKPLWYATDPFAFASERQALEAAGREPRELHPRQLLRYDTESGTVERTQRGFFTLDEPRDTAVEDTVEQVAERLRRAVRRRIPDEPVALLFSGGLDSTVIARILQEEGAPFTCYTAGVQPGNTDPPRDVEWAVDAAETMGLDLKTVETSLDEIETALPRLADWLSTTSPVKLGVALPFHIALDAADERVALSGLGAEQLYAGYARQQGDINRDCLSGLRGIFHRDCYRDDVVSMRHGAELRLPFLDHALVEHSLGIPADHKVRDGRRKYVLRKAAERLGVPEDLAWRDKRAAQYGSNVDKALDRLARDSDAASKQTYLNRLRGRPGWRLAALTSGGKDSNAALYRMQQRHHTVSCLVTLRSENRDSYMFDVKKDAAVVDAQADAMDLPLIAEETAGEEEDELEDLERALERARDEYGVDGVVTGALASQYQRDRVEQVAERVGLKVFSPLWAEDQEQYMRWLVREGFTVEITAVAAAGLDTSWEGRTLDTEAVEELLALAEEHGFQPAGEGGGFETVVVDSPPFDHAVHR